MCVVQAVFFTLSADNSVEYHKRMSFSLHFSM